MSTKQGHSAKSHQTYERAGSDSATPGRPKGRPSDTKSNSQRNSALTQAKDVLSAQHPPALLAVLSPDQTRRRRFAHRFVERFFSEGSSDLATTRISACDLDSKGLRNLYDAMLNNSLFSSTQCFLVRDIEQLNADCAAKLGELIAKLSDLDGPTTHLLLLGGQLSPAHPVRKALSATRAVIEFGELSGPDLEHWIAQELKRLGVTHYPAGAPNLIASTCGENLDQCTQLIEQLALYCAETTTTRAATESSNTETTISDSQLHQFVHAHIGVSEYELLDALSQGQSAKVQSLATKLVRDGKSPFLLISLLSRTFTTFLALRSLLDKGLSDREIQTQMGGPAWLVQKQAAQARHYSSSKLRSCLRAILKADSKLKNRSLGVECVLGEVVGALAAPPARRNAHNA